MNLNNIYSGPDSLHKFFDPDFAPPLPLVELPANINPHRGDGVRVYAKMMTCLPAHNVKALPALNLLQGTVKPGTTTRIIEYSSGSTVISMSLAARALYGIADVRAYMSNKTCESKLKLMRFFGLNLKLFGGPSQPEPTDERGGIQGARREARECESTANPNQYENELNWKAHYRWTGPQLLRQLPEMNVFCTGMGTSGTMTGVGTYLRDHKPSVCRVAVCTAPGDRVHGPRSLALMSPVEFPWREAIDHIEEVGSHPSFAWSMRLSREGLICGPSSGFNLQGLYQFIEKRKKEGTLQELAGEDGEIHCVFVCCDLPYQYIDEYFEKLGEEYFHPIQNQALANVDLYRYVEAWELPVPDAMSQFFISIYSDRGIESLAQPDAIVLDLRRPEDFATGHLADAVNLPLASLDGNTPSPFSDAETLEKQWTELDQLMRGEKVADVSLDLLQLRKRRVLVVCYDGDTSRVATSVLRATDVEAYNMKGGKRALFHSLSRYSPQPNLAEIPISSVEMRKVNVRIEPEDIGT